MPSQRVASRDQVTVLLHDLGGDGPPLLMCHATGFHGMVWAPLAEALAGVAHSWAPDLRGHGDSSLAASGSLAWDDMADDVLAVIDHLGISDVRGVGHSMGGTLLVLAELARPGTFQSMWLYEPVVFPHDPRYPRPRSNPLAESARRRKRWFSDLDAALANYASKPPLGTLDPAALRAYVTHGLRPAADGNDGVELKCAPEVEAAVFEAAIQTDTFGGLEKVSCPVTVAHGGDGAPPALVAPLVAEALPEGRVEAFPQLTHFGPMENPTVIAKSIRDALDL